jgi:iron complex transport system substrate-binding protein
VPPLNILFIELVAKWLHPDLCADIDPDATLSEINRRFFKTPLGGPLWVSLQD